tara:strand:+ start:57 stop:404 length:348 start_codon:yes stop_codon:yes gene_type:complete
MKIYLLAILIVFFSCNQENNSLNNSAIIPQNKFSEIIKELQLAEAKYGINKQTNIEKAKEDLSKSYNKIYMKYKITETDFTKAINYYLSEPEKLLIIYSQAIDSLLKEQSNLNHQ